MNILRYRIAPNENVAHGTKIIFLTMIIRTMRDKGSNLISHHLLLHPMRVLYELDGFSNFLESLDNVTVKFFKNCFLRDISIYKIKSYFL